MADNRAAYRQYARQVATARGLDPDVFESMLEQESGFNPNAKSAAGAMGIAQFMPQTARRYGLANPNDPYKSIDAAASYLSDNLQKLGGRYDLALAGYNWGEHRPQLQQAARTGTAPRQMPAETRNYLASISALTNKKKAQGGSYLQADQSGQMPGPPDLPDANNFDAYNAAIGEVMRSAGIDEQTAAKYLAHPEGQKRYPLPEPYASIIKTGTAPKAATSPLDAIRQQATGQTVIPQASATVAPTVAPQRPTPRAKVSAPQQTNLNSRIAPLQTRLDQLNTELGSLTANSQKLAQAGFPLEQIQAQIFPRAQEKARLEREISELKKPKSTRLQDLQKQLKFASDGRDYMQELGAKATDAADQARYYDQAQQYQQQTQILQNLIAKEQKGEAYHPQALDMAMRPVTVRPGKTTFEQIEGGMGAGAAGVFSGMNELGANILAATGMGKGAEQQLRQRAQAYNELAAQSVADAGEGLTPELAKTFAQVGLTYPLFGGVAGAGRALATRLGAPSLLGEAGALGAYGGLEHAQEGNADIAKAAALNALLPVALHGAAGRALPTRVAANFGAGFIPTYAMGGNLNEAVSQGLIGAAMGLPGGRAPREEPIPVEGELTHDNAVTIPEIVQQQQIEAAKFPNRQNAPTPKGEISGQEIASPEVVTRAVQGGYEIVRHQRPTGENDYYLKHPESEIYHPVADAALMELARNRYKPIETDITGAEANLQPEQGGKPSSAPPAPSAEKGKYTPIDVNISTENPRGTKYAPVEGEAKREQPAAPSADETPQYAYRVRDVGEKGVPEASHKHAQATTSLEDARRLAESRSDNPQEIIRIDLSKLSPAQIERVQSGGKDWIKFKGSVPEDTVQVIEDVPDAFTRAMQGAGKTEEIQRPVNKEESRTFIANDKEQTITDPEKIRQYDEAKARHDELKLRAKNMSDRQSAGKLGKMAGMEFSAAKRKIAGALTAKEQLAARQEESKARIAQTEKGFRIISESPAQPQIERPRKQAAAIPGGTPGKARNGGFDVAESKPGSETSATSPLAESLKNEPLLNIEAQSGKDSPQVTALKIRFDEANQKLQALQRMQKRGHNVSAEIDEQQMTVRRLSERIGLQTSADRPGQAKEEALRQLKKGKVPSIIDLMNTYNIPREQARQIIGEAARERFTEKYGEHIEPTSRQPEKGTPQEAPEQPEKANPNEAKTMQEQATPKQVSAMRAIANAKNIDFEQEAQTRYGTKPEALTKSAAIRFISDLKGMQAQPVSQEQRASNQAFLEKIRAQREQRLAPEQAKPQSPVQQKRQTREQRELQNRLAESVRISEARSAAARNYDIDPQKDSLLSALHKIGIDPRTPEGSDLNQYLKSGKYEKGNRVGTMRRSGLGVDGVLEILNQHGWQIEDKTELFDLIRKEQNGTKVFSLAKDINDEVDAAMEDFFSNQEIHKDDLPVVNSVREAFKDPEFQDAIYRLQEDSSEEAVNQFTKIARYNHGLSDRDIADLISEARGATEEGETVSGDSDRSNGENVTAPPSREGQPVTEERASEPEGNVNQFSSTQANLSGETAKRIKAIAENIPNSALAKDGREAQPHITVKYGLHTNEVKEVRPLIENEAPVTVKLGKISIFPASETKADYDVVKIDVDSPQLHALNKKISDALPHTNTHPEYKPHITLAYVKAGEGKTFAGSHELEGKEITLDKIAFSDKQEKQAEIQLKGSEQPAQLTTEQYDRVVQLKKSLDDQSVTVDDYLKQQGLFGSELNPKQQELLRELDQKTRKGKASEQQQSMFDTAPTLESRQAAKEAEPAPVVSGGLFDRAKAEEPPATKPEPEAAPAKVASPSDLSFDRAMRAHQNTSFVPEERARSRQKEYAEDVNSFYEKMSKLAKTDEQKQILDDEIARYKENYLEKYGKVLDAQSRTASSMITGPARFPTARNQKRMEAADNRYTEFSEWRDKAQKAIAKKLLAARTEEQQQSDAWNRLQKDFAGDLDTIKKLDSGELRGFNRQAFTTSIAGKIGRLAKNGETELVNKALDYIREQQAGMKKPVFAKNNAVWKMGSVAEGNAAKETPTGTQTIAEYDGAKIVNHNDDKRIRITFEGKPDADTIQALKKEAWKWSPYNKSWQRQNTEAAARSAKEILRKSGFKAKEDTPVAELNLSQEETGNFAGQEGFISFGGKPKLLDLARAYTSEPTGANYAKFRLQAAKNGYTDKAEISKAWSDAQDMPPRPSLKEQLADLANAPRTLAASVDLSAPLRQGLILSLAHPAAAFRAGVAMFKSLRNKNLATLNKEIEAHPAMDDARKYDLYLARDAEALGSREELFMSNLIKKLPVLKQLVGKSESAYTTYLDKLRLDTFEQYRQELANAGATEKDYTDAAHFINLATGRGDLPKFAQGMAPFLNGVLFSPRYLTSRFQVLNPVTYGKMSPVARKLAIKDALKFAGTITATLTLAKLAGAQVGLDPEDADFLKIKVGDTRYDTLAGLQQAMRFIYRASRRAYETTTGQKPTGGKTASDIAGDFLRSKLSPTASYITDALKGKDFKGEKFNALKGAYDHFMPMLVKDVIDASREEGARGAVKNAPGVFGVGVQTYKKRGTGNAVSYPKF